jgi:hypothetical protein
VIRSRLLGPLLGGLLAGGVKSTSHLLVDHTLSTLLGWSMVLHEQRPPRQRLRSKRRVCRAAV